MQMAREEEVAEGRERERGDWEGIGREIQRREDGWKERKEEKGGEAGEKRRKKRSGGGEGKVGERRREGKAREMERRGRRQETGRRERILSWRWIGRKRKGNGGESEEHIVVVIIRWRGMEEMKNQN